MLFKSAQPRTFIVLIFIFVGFSLPVWIRAQQPPAPWGKVPPRDLVPVPDLGVEALILFDFGYLTFQSGSEEVRHVLERHRRIKILNKNGLDRGKITLSYITDWETIRRIKAQMILPTGEIVSLRRRDFSEEKLDDYITEISFSFPDLVEGAVIEYQYTKSSALLEELPSWYFQEDIPVRWSEYVLEIPSWYQYQELVRGGKPFINDSARVKKGFSFTGPPSILQRRIVYREMPALLEAPLIKTMDDYRAHIRFFLEAVGTDDVRSFLFTNWQDAARELGKAEDFGQMYTNPRNYSRAWRALASGITPEMTAAEKLDTLYTYLSRNLKWDGTYGIYAASSPNICLSRKIGSKADLNLLLVALLREAGISAWPVLVRTRSRGAPYPQYPVVDQFDYPVVLARPTEQFLYLDLGDPLLPIGYPAIEALNDSGLLVDAKLAQWVDLKAPRTVSSLQNVMQLESDGTLKGSLTYSYRGYQTYFFRQDLGEKPPQDFYRDWVREYYPEATVTNTRIIESEGPGSVVKAQMNLRLPEVVNMTDSLVLVYPILFPLWNENPLQASSRDFPVDLPFSFREEQYLQLDIPADYVLKEVPQPLEIALPDEGGKLKFLVSRTQERQLQIILDLQINRLQFAPGEYPDIKAFFDRFMEKQEGRIVLQKVK